MICSGQLGGKRQTEIVTAPQPYLVGDANDGKVSCVTSCL